VLLLLMMMMMTIMMMMMQAETVTALMTRELKAGHALSLTRYSNAIAQFVHII
jgi:hypothetical protein